MEEKECPEKKEGRGALAAAELIRQPWAATPKQPLFSWLARLLAYLPNLKCLQLQHSHQSIIPYRQPKAPEQTTTNRKETTKGQASHRVPTAPPADPEAWRRLLQLGEQDATSATAQSTWAQPLPRSPAGDFGDS
ncbi:uncharacterized protein TrAFT101_008885 [Trichoderma asperellum]|uniref:uncharacterized protein n=1 Tax=Trichoderma asperellum TaxID=101201 RepID=UPI003333348B|nr:hypothetical protein TrAFT101_008885 [Trichoderma asperellum]